MYNTDIPSRAELPTSRQLLRSTAIAAATAAVLLVTTVLPAEYGIDPTGIGRVLQLTEMGELKMQLAREAEADRALDQRSGLPANVPAPARPDKRSGLFEVLTSPFAIGSAAAAEGPIRIAQAAKSDETSVTLRPNEGVEVKLEMKKGAKAAFEWTVDGGVVNHDTHGEPHNAPNSSHSYSKGRGVGGDKGTLQAAFDGNHGWFWRNRGKTDVTVRLKTNGDYASLKRLK